MKKVQVKYTMEIPEDKFEKACTKALCNKKYMIATLRNKAEVNGRVVVYEFIDSLNSEQFQKVKKFFDTMPKLSYDVKYKCSTCGEDKTTTLEGLDSFFG